MSIQTISKCQAVFPQMEQPYHLCNALENYEQPYAYQSPKIYYITDNASIQIYLLSETIFKKTSYFHLHCEKNIIV